MNDDIEQLLGRLKPTGVEAELRARILAAVENELERSKSRSEIAMRCNHPAGHKFSCVHCGCEAPRAGSLRRWAWPGAAGALACAAAALLLILLTNRPERIAERGIESPPTNLAAATGTTNRPAESIGGPSDPEKIVPARDRAAADVAQAIDDRGLWRRGATSRRLDASGILSAGDTELRGEWAGNIPSTRHATKSTSQTDSSNDRLGSGASRSHIWCESDLLLGAADPLCDKTLNLLGNRL